MNDSGMGAVVEVSTPIRVNVGRVIPDLLARVPTPVERLGSVEV